MFKFLKEDKLKGTMAIIQEGTEYISIGKPEKAIQLYSSQILIRLNRIGYGDSTVTCYLMEEFLKSYEIYDIQRNDLVNLLIRRANAYRSSYEFKYASNDYSIAILLDTTNWRLYFLHGNLYARDLEQYQTALYSYNKSIELNKNEAEVHNNRGLTYEALGYYREALLDIDRALQLAPDNEDFKYNRLRVADQLLL